MALDEVRHVSAIRRTSFNAVLRIYVVKGAVDVLPNGNKVLVGLRVSVSLLSLEGKIIPEKAALHMAK
jgi:hypothetical protein